MQKCVAAAGAYLKGLYPTGRTDRVSGESGLERRYLILYDPTMKTVYIETSSPSFYHETREEAIHAVDAADDETK